MQQKEYTYEIAHELPTLNEYINTERTSRYKAAKMKRVNTNMCAVWAGILPRLEGLFDVEISWETENNRHDSDNIFFGVKFILDGLVISQQHKGSKLKDGRKNIRNISHKIETTGKKNTTVKLIRVE